MCIYDVSYNKNEPCIQRMLGSKQLYVSSHAIYKKIIKYISNIHSQNIFYLI